MTDAAPRADGAPDRLPGWVPRAIALALVGVVGLVLLSWLVRELRSLLVMLLVSLFLSFAFEPAVNWLARRGLRRGVGTALVFLAAFVLGGLFVAAIGSLVVNQVTGFVEQAPEHVRDVERFLNDRLGADVSADRLAEELAREEGPLRDFAARLAGNALGLSATVLGFVFQVFTVALFSFYLVADGPRLRRVVLSAFRPERQRDILRTWELAIDKTGAYIYSRGLLAVLAGGTAWVAFVVIGVPYALALGLWVGVMSQFVPVVGTYLAGVLPVLVALGDEPVDALWVLGVIVAYQQFENYVLAPRVTARTMAMHPAVAFGAVVAGASLFGAVGAVLALPAAAIVQAFASTYIERHEVVDSHLLDDRRTAPPAPPTPPPE